VRQVFRLSMASIWPTEDAKHRGDMLGARCEFKHKLWLGLHGFWGSGSLLRCIDGRF
jgi:hypothetical protein